MSFHRNRMNGFLCILHWDSGSSKDSLSRAIVVNKKNTFVKISVSPEKNTSNMKEFVFSAPAQRVLSPVKTGNVDAHTHLSMPGCTDQCGICVHQCGLCNCCGWNWAQTFPAESRSRLGQDKHWHKMRRTHQSWRGSSPISLQIHAGTQWVFQCLQDFTSHLFTQLLTGTFLGILRQSLNLYFY